MGDNGKLYVPQELVEVYRDEVIVKADFLLPNQTEIEYVKPNSCYKCILMLARYLTGLKLVTESDAIKAIDVLHDKGIGTVIIKSLFHDKDDIVLLGSTRQKGRL